MNKMTFLFFTTSVLLIVSAFPLYQMETCKGHLYYQNAFDEAWYLQYDFSKINQRVSRPGQYLVTLAHEANLSAGWINFWFDIFFVVSFVLLARVLFKKMGYDEFKANAASALLTLGPLLFLGANPFVRRLFYETLNKGWIYWIAVPEAVFLPIVRSPEPQFSIFVVCLCACLSLARKKIWYMYFCLPFLYPFIAVPLAFVLFSFHIKQKISWFSQKPIWCLIVSYFLIIFLEEINFLLLVPPSIKIYLTPSHLPYFSFTCALGLVLYLFLYKLLPEDKRFFLLASVVSPLATENCQIVTGRFLQAVNTEQYFGVYAVTLVGLFAVLNFKYFKTVFWPVFILSFLFLLNSTNIYFKECDQVLKQLPLNDQLLNWLKNDSPNVAIDDGMAASTASMLFSKQPMTLFGFGHTPSPVEERDLQRYLCAKKQILGDSTLCGKYGQVLNDMDRWFRYENADGPFVTVGRRKTYVIEHDMNAVPSDCKPMTLHYVFIQ